MQLKPVSTGVFASKTDIKAVGAHIASSAASPAVVAWIFIQSASAVCLRLNSLAELQIVGKLETLN
jgi:hypothetical protein